MTFKCIRILIKQSRISQFSFCMEGKTHIFFFFLVVEPLTLGKVELNEVKTTSKKNYRLEMV